ncbi:MAG: hypothetical protein JSS66_05015 [Armatimonadetes bacterium]|nr:hypothetical protein [Armatimonadota bacterium]
MGIVSLNDLSIGVAVTTRNRPDVLSVCLTHFRVFGSDLPNAKFVVLDDNSDEPHATANRAICANNGFEDSYVYADDRLGIAKAKNRCLTLLSPVDYYFLFDDDCFPKKKGWDLLYVSKSRECSCHHLLYNAHVGPYAPIGCTRGIEEYNAELGVLMLMSQHCVDTLGGFDERYGLYGHEHMEYARRAQAARMTNGLGRSCVPKGADEYIYAFDLDWQMQRVPPPLQSLASEFKCSLFEEPLEAYRIISRRANGEINEEVAKGARDAYVPLEGQTGIEWT